MAAATPPPPPPPPAAPEDATAEPVSALPSGYAEPSGPWIVTGDQWLTLNSSHGVTRVRADTITHYWKSSQGARVHLISGQSFDVAHLPDDLDAMLTAGV